jgi:hypothetical protein
MTSAVEEVRGTAHGKGLPLAIGLTMVASAGVVLGALSRRRPAVDRSAETRGDALVAYLHDHLGGAEVAIQVVDRLRRSATRADERALFEWLHHEFERDRGTVGWLIEALGASPRSTKRMVGYASGSLLKFLAGGTRGDLALFRTLEALAIGVQGKRCMWRALQALRPGVTISGIAGAPSLPALESAALKQWEAIEEWRRALVPQTFAATASDRSSGPRTRRDPDEGRRETGARGNWP